MASSSSSHPDVFSGTWRKVDESSKLYDVFINHRGPDVKQTVALNLYNSLKKLGIKTFLDKEEKELGKSFLSTIETAINSALVHIAIFSENYAESSWCLEELLLMLRSKTKIIPLFYKVKPFDLRFVENGRYAKAFTDYEKKKRYIEKLSEWKDALRSVSFIAGVEISDNFNISDYQNIVLAVRNEIRRRSLLYVAKHPVGLDRLEERLCLHQHVEDFERKCRTNEGGRKKAQIFGIVGMGGVGKTTLAKELFNRKLLDYSRVCFLFDVREAYENNRFHHLQMQLLQHLFQRQFNFLSIEEGKSHIDGCIRRNNHSSFLILLDDVDDMKQLDALLIMEMLKNSDDNLVIVTTRDAGVLIKTGIAETYKLTEMNRNYAGELFCQHAFGRPNPDSGYENLVSSFLDVCGGLPLSLQVLGSHVHGTNQNYWSLELKKVIKTLPQDIYQRLKISFDALDYEEQQIFMDLACFFVEQSKSIPIEVWEASGWSAQHALKTLENRCLVQEIEIRDSGGQKRSVLGMHDHLRDLGRKVAESSSGPRRLWCPRELPCLESSRFQDILSEPGNRCFHSFYDKPTARQITYFLGDSDKNADTSTFFKLKELESIKCIIILKNLRCLIFWEMPSQTLWQRHLQASNNLKELQIRNTSLDKRLDLSGICNSLEKLLIYNCSVRLVTLSGLSYLVELNISGCDGLDELSAVHLSCLQKMILNNCCRLKTVSGSDLRKLVELGITGCPVNGQLHLAGLNSLERIQVDHSLKPKCLELDDCRSLETISGIDLRNLVTINIRNCPKLEVLPSIQGSRYLRNLVTINIRNCPKLEVLPSIQGSRYLKTVTIDGCGKPKSLLLSRFQNLEGVTLKSGVDCLEKITIEGCGKLNRLQLFKYQNLKQVSISCCWELEELPCLAGQTCLEEISLVRCEKLQDICLPPKLVELKIEGCRELKTVVLCCNHSECLELQELSSVARSSCVKRITVQRCNKLQTIQGFADLHAMENLQLSNCPELEDLLCSPLQTRFKKIGIVRCGKLQNIILPISLVELRIEGCKELKTVAAIGGHGECVERIKIESCDKLQTIQGIEEMDALTSLQLFSCPELEELQCSSRQTYLEKIGIVRCGKLQNIILPPKLVELLIVGCRELKTVTPCCHHSECLELQELSSIAQLSHLKWITIQKCDKLQTIQGIDELRALESMQLSYCSNAAIQNCILMLKSVQPEFMAVAGRAVDGAQSTLNPHLFSDADVAIAEIDARRSDKKLALDGEFSAIIVSVVVVVNSYTPVARINESLSDCYWSQLSKFDVQQGEWIVTIVTTEQHKRRIYCNHDRQFEDVLVKHGIMKKGYKVGVKKGEEWKTQRVMHAILNRLYQK